MPASAGKRPWSCEARSPKAGTLNGHRFTKTRVLPLALEPIPSFAANRIGSATAGQAQRPAAKTQMMWFGGNDCP